MKKRFIPLICLGGVVAVALGFCGFVIINGTAPRGKAIGGREEWMKEIDDEALLNNIAIPGSHDAGTKGMVWLGATQNLSVYDQLIGGTRYFDLRVNQKEEGDYVIYHSIINGDKFEPIISDIKDFIKTYPSETLLLDFQHFDNGAQQGVLSFVNDYLLDNDLLIKNDSGKSDLEFISTLKLKDARGKCLVFWGDRGMTSSYDYLFPRNNDTCEHEGMALDSYYEEDFHKELTPNKFIDEAMPFYFNDIKEKKDQEGYKGIFVLQCQLTDGDLIFGPYSKEKQFDSVISNYISNDIIKDEEKLSLVNVIMRDFVNKKKCDDIIELNKYKKIM